MARTVTISAVQLPLYPGCEPEERRETNIAIACEMLSEAGRRGSDIACLPETFSTMHIPHAPFEQVPGEVTERVGAVAREHGMYVIAPVAGVVDGTPRNVAIVLDRGGEIVGMYFKVHIGRTVLSGEPASGLVAGDSWPVFELDFGRIGIQICHDNSFPESARCLALNGAEIIFWPHMQSGWGDVVWDITLRSRAIDNGVYHVSACYGVQPNRAWRPGITQGRSGIVRPDGFFAAEAGRYPGIATAEVELEPRIVAAFTGPPETYYWHAAQVDRMPETYGPITRPRAVTEHVEPSGPRPWLNK